MANQPTHQPFDIWNLRLWSKHQPLTSLTKCHQELFSVVDFPGGRAALVQPGQRPLRGERPGRGEGGEAQPDEGAGKGMGARP